MVRKLMNIKTIAATPTTLLRETHTMYTTDI